MYNKKEGNPESLSFWVCHNSQARIIRSSNMPYDFFKLNTPVIQIKRGGHPKTQMQTVDQSL